MKATINIDLDSIYVQSNELAERPHAMGLSTSGQPATFPPSTQKTQFINIADSISLDKSSRTKVRVQAMRDYHRRRIESVDIGPRPNHIPKKPLSAKAQTHKFRLGEENLLKPWVPVKSEPARKVATRRNRDDVYDPLSVKAAIIDVGGIISGNDAVEAPSTSLQDNVDHQHDRDQTQIGKANDTSLLVSDTIMKATKLYGSPGAGRLDPFSAMSLNISPRIQLLIDHYFNTRQQTAWLMLPMRKTLFSLAIHDTAMFHSFTTHYATSFNVRYDNGSFTESLYHATKAVNIVNERLSDPILSLTNETIATVANMAAFESSNGTAASMIVHMDGLEKMVNMRGGIENGGFPLIVQRMIGWADYHVAISLLREPRFPPLRIPQTAQPQHAIQQNEDSPPQSFHDANPTLESLLSEMREIARTLRSFRQKATMPTEDIWYSDKIYYLQRSLFDIAHTPSHISSNQNPSDSVLALTALIYSGHCLRDIPLGYSVTAKAVTRLRHAIEVYEISNFWIGDLEITRKMVWVLVFGGVAAEGKVEWSWFVGKFGAAFGDLGVAGWEDLRGVLESVLWEPGLDGAGMRVLDESKAIFIE
ncbi:hypothetical protein VTL71DRAFT_12221 [Oculimacula yallundae]|uniref:Tachykinin family protein n=1 Tax=Oculimacula yallundae TaxID=86028 RepID=A0ABR4CU27_9HELO